MKIKEARKQKGLTQKEVSEALGIPNRTLESWEQGKRACPEWCEKLVVNAILNL